MESEHEKFQKIVAERKRILHENNKLYSSKRLADNMKKKIKTTMIGAISVFEEFFGDLWGIGKDPGELNEDELYWRDLWEKARIEALNKGNKQIRICDEEISEYDIFWNRYTIEFRKGK